LLHRLAKTDRKLACPAARAALSAENERLERLAGFELGADAARAALQSLKRRLYPYQRASVERFLTQGRMLLADDMGLGKTTQAIAVCHALYETGAVKRGLLVAPASLKSQWLREWNDTTDAPAAIVEGPPAERLRQYRATKSGFLILGYE